MVPSLTSGSIQRLLNDEEVPKAVVQLLGYKLVAGGSGTDRYRLLVSDGVTVCQYAMLGTQLNNMITNKQLDNLAVIQINKCVSNSINGDKKLLILLDITVLSPGSEVGVKIGNPEPARSGANASTKKPVPGELGAGSSSNMNGRSTLPQNNMGNSDYSSSNDMNVHPISSLTPYQNKWTIKARITSKTPIKTWSNSRGEGKLFSINMLDETGEIRATAFNDAVDKFFDLIQVNQVYYLSKATLKPANKQFSSVKNDYEISFNNDTTITPCEESTSSIPMLQFDFVPISQIENIDKDATIDVIGVCKSAAEPQTIVTRATNRELVKRELRLVDTSNIEVNLTLWADEALKFDPTNNPVVAVKGARVSDFNGRSISLLLSSVFQVNPDIKDAHVLRGWYDRIGCQTESQSISAGRTGGGSFSDAWKTFSQVNAEKLGMGDKPDYYTAKAAVVMIRKENCMYMACPSQDCNKKVIDMNNGLYRCEKCNKEYPEFKWRLLLSVSLADFTENIWVTCFQEAAEAILGVSAEELGSCKENDEEKFNEIISEANFKSFIFKLRVKMEMFNEENRLKTVVVTATPIEPVVYGKKLLGDVKQIQQSL